VLGDHLPSAELQVDPHWDTIHSDRTVLLVARTLTSATRLLDVLDIFRGDFRVRPVFTVDDGTRSGAGVRELLQAAGVPRIVPWSALPSRDGYHLAITASEQIDLDTISSTVVVLPHGVGFNKYVPDGETGGRRIAGVPPTAALRTGRVRLVLSHPDQQAQLAATHPDIVGQAVVTGDPTFDRLRANLAHRTRYRDALDAGNRTVVMLSSTWGTESAFGRWRELLGQLLAVLPTDEYRVVAALHPNIWSRHNPATIRTWLADCLDSGLRLLPPERGWQATLVAADLVIGDHGSNTLLAAALGKPILLAAFGPADEVVPGTPVAEFGRMTPRLDPTRSLQSQLDKAVTEHNPHDYAPIVARTFAHVGEASNRLRELVYRELQLSLPAGPALLRRFAEPAAMPGSATAFDVYAEFSTPRTVTVCRFPRQVQRPEWSGPSIESEGGRPLRHLAVDEQCPDLRLLHAGSVITRSDVTSVADAHEWTRNILHQLPGARVAAAATPAAYVAQVRDRGTIEISVRSTPVRCDDTQLLASALHRCVIEGAIADGAMTVRAGARVISCELCAQ
jgi:hypothetical protein